MDTMSVSKFKATCRAAFDRARRTGRPLRVTRFGKPLADIVPAAPEPAAGPWLEAMKGRGRVLGDLVESAAPVDHWNASR